MWLDTLGHQILPQTLNVNLFSPTQSTETTFMDFTKSFNIVTSDTYLADLVLQRSTYALLWMQDWVNYHQNMFFNQILLCLNTPKIKLLGVGLQKFNPSHWVVLNQLPSCLLGIVTLPSGGHRECELSTFRVSLATSVNPIKKIPPGEMTQWLRVFAALA